MKYLLGWAASLGMAVTAAAAQAQSLPPMKSDLPPFVHISDVGGPYAAIPPSYGDGYARFAPPILPPREIYAILRESGFSPLGAPRQRGLVYTVSAIDRDGEDGRMDRCPQRPYPALHAGMAHGRPDGQRDGDALRPGWPAARSSAVSACAAASGALAQDCQPDARRPVAKGATGSRRGKTSQAGGRAGHRRRSAGATGRRRGARRTIRCGHAKARRGARDPPHRGPRRSARRCQTH